MSIHQLKTIQLSMRRNHRILIKQLDLTASSGQIIQVTGANGAGKTTLLRLLSGMSTPTQGHVLWNGQTLPWWAGRFERELLYLGHQTGLKEDLSPIENLQTWLHICGQPQSTSLISEALAQLGLHAEQHRPLRTLSAGQRRRAALARLWLEQKPLWILDEPLTALDPIGIAILEAQIAQHAAQGGIVILTSHQPLQSQTTLTQLSLDAQHKVEVS